MVKKGFAVIIVMFSIVALSNAQNVNIQLLKGAAQGNFYTASEALEAGADINTTDPNGATPLMYAAAKNKDEMIEFLAERGAHVNFR